MSTYILIALLFVLIAYVVARIAVYKHRLRIGYVRLRKPPRVLFETRRLMLTWTPTAPLAWHKTVSKSGFLRLGHLQINWQVPLKFRGR